MTDTDQGDSVQPSERPATSRPRECEQCSAPIPPGAAFCSNCGADVPAPPLTFDALPEWWKKAAAGLLGVTLLGILISAFWPSAAPAPPAEPEVEAAPAVSEAKPATKTLLPFPSQTRRSTPKKADSPPTGEWDVRTESSPLDDIKTVFLDLKAMDSPKVRGTSSLTPQMSFMCTGKEVEGYVFVRAPPEVGRSRYATVRVRFDTLEPQTLRMEPSAEQDALFFNKPASVLKQMLGHERMLFGFKPRGSEETVTEFDLRGVDEAVKPFADACDVPELTPKEPEPGETPTDP